MMEAACDERISLFFIKFKEKKIEEKIVFWRRVVGILNDSKFKRNEVIEKSRDVYVRWACEEFQSF